MNFKSFRLAIVLRLVLITATIFLMAYLAFKENYWASVFGLSLLLVLQIWRLICLIEKTHSELNDFFQALMYDDTSRRFTVNTGTATDVELARAFERVQTRFQNLRQTNEELVRYYSLLLEKVPTALVVFGADQSLEMINIAAQRLFQRSNRASPVELENYGEEFLKNLRDIVPGENRTTVLNIQQSSLSVVLTAAVLRIGGVEKKVITVQPIQQELDAREIQAWQNLVQVFTHEIMNSMTPVASLSQTASNLLSELDLEFKHLDAHEKITDAGFAINTLARRADHLMKFVQAYQRVANPPVLQKSSITIQPIFEEICRLFEDRARRQKVKISWQVVPAQLSFTLDSVQVEQALINLVKNSLDALLDQKDGEIFLSAYLGRDGNLTMEISDNGEGICTEKREQIFVPFYTSKAEGSGIGLFLVKQVMQAHQGSVRALAGENGGALFRLSFS